MYRSSAGVGLGVGGGSTTVGEFIVVGVAHDVPELGGRDSSAREGSGRGRRGEPAGELLERLGPGPHGLIHRAGYLVVVRSLTLARRGAPRGGRRHGPI